MTTETVTETVLDLATNTRRTAHLRCDIADERPDEPTHALCGYPLVGVDAPAGAPKCATCRARMEAGGGPFASLLGLLRCAEHTP